MTDDQKLYYSAAYEAGVSRSEFKRLIPEQQLALMSRWFTSAFIDISYYQLRAQTYRAAPCDVADELAAEFGGIVLDKVITELAERLTSSGEIWVPIKESQSAQALSTSNISVETDILMRLAALEMKLETLHGAASLGHNNPPEPIEEFPLSYSDASELRGAIEVVRREIGSESRDKPVIKNAIQIFAGVANKVGSWLASKADTAATELSKAVGKAAGVGVIAHLAGIDRQLWELIHILSQWISHW